MDYIGLIVTSHGENVDFVSRFFAPQIGVPEDPVTGNPIDVNNRYFVGIPRKYRVRYCTKIIGFDPDDTIEINETSYGVSDPVVDFARNKRNLSKLINTDADFIYFEKNGRLFFNENQSQPGFGDGGVIAKLFDKPKLDQNNFNFISMVDNLQLLPVQSII